MAPRSLTEIPISAGFSAIAGTAAHINKQPGREQMCAIGPGTGKRGPPWRCSCRSLALSLLGVAVSAVLFAAASPPVPPAPPDERAAEAPVAISSPTTGCPDRRPASRSKCSAANRAPCPSGAGCRRGLPGLADGRDAPHDDDFAAGALRGGNQPARGSVMATHSAELFRGLSPERPSASRASAQRVPRAERKGPVPARRARRQPLHRRARTDRADAADAGRAARGGRA